MRSLALPHFVDTRFQILFTPLPGYFFTFPSRYYTLSVIDEYLGLESGLPGFSQSFTCSDLLGILLGLKLISLTGLSPSMTAISNAFSYQFFMPRRSPATPIGKPIGLASSAFARHYLRNLC